MYKEYEIKTKMEQEQWGGGVIDFWWGNLFFKVGEWGGDEQIFSWRTGTPPIPPVKKTLMDGFNCFMVT